MEDFTADDIRCDLRSRIGPDQSAQQLAQRIGISPSFLSDVLASHREPSGKILQFLRLERVISYRRLSENGDGD